MARSISSRQHGAVRSRRRRRVRLRSGSRIAGSAMKPHLTTSARPARRSDRRQGRQRVQVDEHPGRLVEAADQVLALRGVDAGLAADCGVDHAEHRGRHGDQPDAAQPGRGDEAGQIGGGAAAEPDHRVGSGEAGRSRGPTSNERPPRRSWPPPRPARRSGSASSPAPRSTAHQRSASSISRGGCSSATRWVSRPSSDGQLVGQTVADHDLVRGLAPHLDHRWRQPRPAPERARIRLDDLFGGPAVGVDHLGGGGGVERGALGEQLDQPAADVAEQQGPGLVEPDPLARRTAPSPAARPRGTRRARPGCAPTALLHRPGPARRARRAARR